MIIELSDNLLILQQHYGNMRSASCLLQRKGGVKMKTEKLPVPLSEKYLLTCQEAASYFNLGVKNLRRMARNPTLKVGLMIYGRYLIVRPRLEEYILRIIDDNIFAYCQGEDTVESSSSVDSYECIKIQNQTDDDLFP